MYSVFWNTTNPRYPRLKNQSAQRLQVPIFADHIEARTGFARIQISMAHNKGLGISLMKLFEQTKQGDTLGFRAGIGRLTFGGQASDVAYSNGVPVMALAVSPGHFFGSAGFDSPVRRDDVVIAASYPTERTMIAVNVCHPKGTARLVGGAVHDNQRDGSHRWVPSAPPAAPLMSNSMNLTT